MVSLTHFGQQYPHLDTSGRYLRMTRHIIMMAGWLILTGCVGTPTPSERYTLPGPEHVETAGADTDQVLLIDSLTLAGYLDSDGIVLQLDELRLNEARQHRWAERLDRQLERGLRQRLATTLEDTRITMDADDTRASDTVTHLRITIDRFQGDHRGYAIASGQWQLRDEDDRLVTARSFDERTELTSDGYAALVRALGQSWDRVGKAIATAVREMR